MAACRRFSSVAQSETPCLGPDGEEIGDDAGTADESSPAEQDPDRAVGIIWQKGGDHRAAGLGHHDQLVGGDEIPLADAEDLLLQLLGVHEFASVRRSRKWTSRPRVERTQPVSSSPLNPNVAGSEARTGPGNALSLMVPAWSR